VTAILAVDPGTYETGLVIYDTDAHHVPSFGIYDNYITEKMIKDISSPTIFAYEMIGHYGTGMSVGKEVFHTCIWIGKFESAWKNSEYFAGREDKPYMILNREIRLTLCGTAKAKEKNIRQAVLDRFPATGGGACPQKGTKKNPGPLYGMKSHVFSALAVALTWKEMYGKKEN